MTTKPVSTTIWACPVCTLENPVQRRRCQACESRRPVEDTSSTSSPCAASPRSTRAVSFAITSMQHQQQPNITTVTGEKEEAPLRTAWLQRRSKRKRLGGAAIIKVTLRVNDATDAYKPLVAALVLQPRTNNPPRSNGTPTPKTTTTPQTLSKTTGSSSELSCSQAVPIVTDSTTSLTPNPVLLANQTNLLIEVSSESSSISTASTAPRDQKASLWPVNMPAPPPPPPPPGEPSTSTSSRTEQRITCNAFPKKTNHPQATAAASATGDKHQEIQHTHHVFLPCTTASTNSCSTKFVMFASDDRTYSDDECHETSYIPNNKDASLDGGSKAISAHTYTLTLEQEPSLNKVPTTAATTTTSVPSSVELLLPAEPYRGCDQTCTSGTTCISQCNKLGGESVSESTTMAGAEKSSAILLRVTDDGAATSRELDKNNDNDNTLHRNADAEQCIQTQKSTSGNTDSRLAAVEEDTNRLTNPLTVSSCSGQKPFASEPSISGLDSCHESGTTSDCAAEDAFIRSRSSVSDIPLLHGTALESSSTTPTTTAPTQGQYCFFYTQASSQDPCGSSQELSQDGLSLDKTTTTSSDSKLCQAPTLQEAHQSPTSNDISLTNQTPKVPSLELHNHSDISDSSATKNIMARSAEQLPNVFNVPVSEQQQQVRTELHSDPAPSPAALFTTAGSNKQVSASASGLAHASKLLGKEYFPSEAAEIADSAQTFKTAGRGSRVIVSASSMLRATELLREESPNNRMVPSQQQQQQQLCSFWKLDNKYAAMNRHGQPRTSKSVKVAMFTDPARPLSATAAGNGNPTTAPESSIARATPLCHNVGAPHVPRIPAPSHQLFFQHQPSDYSLSDPKAPTFGTHLSHTAKVDLRSPSLGSQAQSQTKLGSFPTFSTAGRGLVVAVSSDSLALANQLLCGQIGSVEIQASRAPGFSVVDLDKRTYPSQAVEDYRRASSSGSHADSLAMPSTFPAFCSAGQGQEVAIPAESLARANNLFCEQPDSIESPASLQRSPRVSFFDHNKRSYPSPAAEGDQRTSSLGSQAEPLSMPSRFPAFCTAGRGREVAISDESLARANKLLCDQTGSFETPASLELSRRVSFFNHDKRSSPNQQSIHTASVSSSFNFSSHTTRSLPMFTTAGKGCRVAVSAANIARAHSLLEDQTSVETPAVSLCSHRVSFLDVDKTPLGGLRTKGREGSCGILKPAPATGSINETPATGIRPQRVSFFSVEANDALQADRFFHPGSTPLLSRPTQEKTIDFQGARITLPKESFGERVLVTETPAAYSLRCPSLETVSQESISTGNQLIQEESDATAQHGSVNVGFDLRAVGDSPTKVSLVKDITRSLGNEHIHSDSACTLSCDESEEFNSSAKLQKSPVFSLAVLTKFSETCLNNGVHLVTLRVDSLMAPLVRFDSKSKLPIRFFEPESMLPQFGIGETQDYRKALLDIGLDLSAVKDRWISNHTRWIIWKLASIERRLSRAVGGSYLTFDRIVENLKARFEREVVKGERPPLRMILNRDVSSLLLMILCVARIRISSKASQKTISLELTDGWYSIQASLDFPLTDFVRKGIIKVGTKLLLSNASLGGCEEGVDPLDESYDAMDGEKSPVLFITANATRLARWDSKLGFVQPTKTTKTAEGLIQATKISDVLPSGGRIPLIDLVVVRKYPLLYREKVDKRVSLSKGPETRCRIFTESEEEERLNGIEKNNQLIIESITDEVEAECAEDVDKGAPDIWHDFLQHQDPEVFFASLDEHDKTSLDAWMERRSVRLHARIQQEIDARLDELGSDFAPNTPFVRVLVRSSCISSEKPTNGCKAPEEAMLTFWNPTHEQIEAIQEGNVLRIKNLGVGNTRYDGLLQLTANSCTQVSIASDSTAGQRKGLEPQIGLYKIPRIHLHTRTLLESSNTRYCSRDVDVIGIVLKAAKHQDEPGWSLYVTDKSGILLRVHSYLDRDIFTSIPSLVSSSTKNAKACILAAFRHVRVSPFDKLSCSAVVQFKETSIVSFVSESRQARSLQRWVRSDCGSRRIGRLASFLDARLPVKPSSIMTALGYITEFYLVQNQQLLIDVDCSGGNLQTWKFPLSLLQGFLTSCNDMQEYVVLNAEDEKGLAYLTNVGSAFRSRRHPFRFLLQRLSTLPSDFPLCKYEVLDVSTVDTEALAACYLENT